MFPTILLSCLPAIAVRPSIRQPARPPSTRRRSSATLHSQQMLRCLRCGVRCVAARRRVRVARKLSVRCQIDAPTLSVPDSIDIVAGALPRRRSLPPPAQSVTLQHATRAYLAVGRACVRACAELCQAKNGSAEAKTAGVASDIDAVARSAALEASIRRDFRASSAGSSARARRSPGTGRRNGTGTENARD